ncbi:26S proteasome non-ATPase regulatory subunit 1 homolog A-like [Camellia sinensis]|uniref:26S proteasome non-ATPase regulatory subunit 1 homolog A-like n=1 Tax=Camellia sinensis TaxID=4442 RepID=UPI001035C4ED|nr:26S proteasome non-ATPase regulatory subunit 1 homolog A-like [Camellia sinensis]
MTVSDDQRAETVAASNDRRSATLVYYYLGELNDSLSYALGAGPLFDVSKGSDYIHTLLAKAIDEYASLKSKVAESNDENKMDPRLEAIVERMLDKCILDGRYQLSGYLPQY